MVDIIRPKKRFSTKRILMFAGILAIVLLIFGSYYFTSGKSKLNVDVERITISEVKKGAFQENIPENGVVLPIYSIYLDATEGGRVEEKYVEDGAFVNKDQPILRLSNIDEKLNLVTQENNVYNTLAQMQLGRTQAQQNTVTKLQTQADVESAYIEAKRVYDLDKRLFDQKVIGLQEYKSAENNFKYQAQRRNLTLEILRQDSISTAISDKQNQQTLETSRNALEIMRQKVGDLIVRARVDGQLTSLTAEIGQNVNKGDRLGQVDILTSFKVRVGVDEHYISRIFTGQTATWPTGDSIYKLKITKVYTQVNPDGRFNVDMVFVGSVPKGIRRGQTLQILVALSDEKQAVMVAQGGFFQQTGGNWIFKVSDDGKTAYRVDMQLGNKNTDNYEVLQGLKPGDKVITSSYENYGNYQELVLKK
jgi:HlyD family secretion protein